MVLGSQAIVAAAEAPRVAEAVRRLGVPVYLSGMARGLLGRDPALQMRHARRKALREADFVLLAGVPCDFRLDYGKHVRRSATLIAANRSRKDARLNRKPTIEAIGDAGRFIVALAERVGDGARREEWIRTLAARDAEREQEIDAQAQASGEHVNPVAFFRALDKAAGENAIFVADGGDFVGTASYILRPRGPLAWLDPGAFGTLGVGAGFALGASVVKPPSEVWLVWGDGACGYGLAEFDTFVRHGIPVIAVVGNDAGWTQIAREQVKMLGDDVGTVLRAPPTTTSRRVSAPRAWKSGAIRTSRRDSHRRGGSRRPASRCSSTSGSTRPNSAKGRSRCRFAFEDRAASSASANVPTQESPRNACAGQYGRYCASLPGSCGIAESVVGR